MTLEKRGEERDKDVEGILREVIHLIELAKPVEYKSGRYCKVIRIGSGSKNSEFGYFLTYYDDGTITVTLKKYRNQSNSFAIFKLTDKIIDVEDLDTFVDKMSKIFNIVKGIRGRNYDRGIDKELI